MNHYQGQSTSCHVFPHSSPSPSQDPQGWRMESFLLPNKNQLPRP